MRLFLSALLLTAALGAARRPHVVFVTGDDEYRSEYSMPMIARILEARYGARASVAYARPKPSVNNNIEGLEALKDADLAVFFLRWRRLPDEQIQYILEYLKTGRPLVGLRTTTHSFRYPKDHALERWNDAFGIEVFGQKWLRHHGHLSTTEVRVTADHPVTRGVEKSFQVPSWLYEVTPLHGDVSALAEGKAINPQGKDASPQPVAWTKTYHGARVFFTTLGHPDDFKVPAVRRLLVNGILWALGREVPKGGANVEIVGDYDPPPSGIQQ